MFNKKLEVFFIALVVVALLYLANNIYMSNQFKNNDIPDSYKTRLKNKETEVLNQMQKHYGLKLNIPMIVTDKFKGRLYGLTSYKNGEIKIYLNKKVMQESMDYVVESVIAHEYAHALMFKLGKRAHKKDGHSIEWQETCVKLGGRDCQQYVDQQEIVMSKMPFQ
ncbi:SprT-like domain-containing protein [Sulfurimonas sp.]|nr:SprT-like domain-containing protein [Sulfurimonas sp.]